MFIFNIIIIYRIYFRIDFFIPDKGDKWNTENIDENEKDINENGIEKVMFGRKFGGLHGMKKTMNGIMKIKKNPPLEKELEITLEQLYNGAIKCVKIERKVCHLLRIKIEK